MRSVLWPQASRAGHTPPQPCQRGMRAGAPLQEGTELLCSPPKYKEENQIVWKLEQVLFPPHFQVSQLFLNCQKEVS